MTMLCTLNKYNFAKDQLPKKHIKIILRKNHTSKAVNPQNKSTDVKNDLIGPADPISNLRPIIFAKPENESCLEKKYRETRQEIQEWNRLFWTKHNTNFKAERKQFQDSLKAQGKLATADDMSIFYKKFLDENWKAHVNYNISWYKKNITLLLYEIRVRLSKMKFT